MLRWLRTLILYRLLGGRALLALAAVGWLWRRLRGERDPRDRRDARGVRDSGSARQRASVARARGGRV